MAAAEKSGSSTGGETKQKDHGTPAESMTVRSARGDYDLVDPLDYMILDWLPDEGAMFAGLYPLGLTVAALHGKFSKEQQAALTITALTARMRVLNIQGLAVIRYSGVSSGGKRVWQRTKNGAKVLKQWKEARSGTRG